MKVSKITNLLIMILAPLVLSSCVISKGDENDSNTGCYTFDEIFDVSKLDDSVGGRGLKKQVIPNIVLEKV